MSTQDRLARLGLSHLAGEPEALLAELERRIAEDEAKAAEWRAEAAKIRERLTTDAARGGAPKAGAKRGKDDTR